MPESVTVDIYCRTATEKQPDEPNSLEEQERLCRQYCQEHSLLVGVVYQEVFSGIKYLERKLLTTMRECYRRGITQGIVITALDRLSRSMTHLAILVEEMEKHGIELYVVSEVGQDAVTARHVRMTLAFIAGIQRDKSSGSPEGK